MFNISKWATSFCHRSINALICATLSFLAQNVSNLTLGKIACALV